ncbi:hypothetical protein O6H91_07G021500 [Diphasiastrum complanatum]|uniref:Uncharacterized protein n=1 Tax=Diphasiastrum complanatum TaxID=34168 RepID=A0ACC2D3E8_DIPCM|nr:hypothetical protein O6H91_Y090000 [Diphasiastrum complanatum]KAJ7548663.1 hypothetical protein O6H91_07G021500 [Diphasiastrum complanatum]
MRDIFGRRLPSIEPNSLINCFGGVDVSLIIRFLIEAENILQVHWEMGLYLSVVVLAVSIAMAAGWLTVLKNSPLVDPLPAVLPPRPKEEGVFAHNALLHGVEKIGVGQVPGPEDLAVDSHGRIYTGCSDGWIKRVETDGRVVNWMYVGGRPTGVAVGLHEEILVCDAIQGLLNVTEGKVEVLSTEADGLKYKLTDALDVANDGTIYFTDASHKYDINNYQLDFLESRPYGRLLKYDPSTGKTTVLVKDLFFGNGVALSQKQDFLVFCETCKARCQRYWLVGEKKGSVENFIDSLPGYPDNIRNNKKGKLYVALSSSRSWFGEEVILRFSVLKRFLAHPRIISIFFNNLPKTSRILVVSEEGTPLALYEDPNGKEVLDVTSGLEVGEYLYLGSLATNYISRLKLQ